MRRRRSSRRSSPSLLRRQLQRPPTPELLRLRPGQGGCLRRQVRRWAARRRRSWGVEGGRLFRPGRSGSPRRRPLRTRIGSTSGSGTISSSTRTSSAVSTVAGRSSQATGGQKHRTARLAGATIRFATMRGVPTGKRRRYRRWGSKAEPFRRERSRHCLCGPVLIRRRRWSRICTRHMRRRRELRQQALDGDCRWEGHRPRGGPTAFEHGLNSLQLA